MTITKSRCNPSSAIKAVTPKRSVSFSIKGVAKFKQPTKAVQPSLSIDYELQSTDKRRRYMRRGSKAPSMFFISEEEIIRLQEETPDTEKLEQERQCTLKQTRRLSVMAALKCHFDNVSLLDNHSTTYSTIRRISSFEKQRRFSLDLVTIL